MRRALRHVTFTVGLAVTLVLLATAALSLVYTPKDPLEYWRKLCFHRAVTGPASYGLD